MKINDYYKVFEGNTSWGKFIPCSKTFQEGRTLGKKNENYKIRTRATGPSAPTHEPCAPVHEAALATALCAPCMAVGRKCCLLVFQTDLVGKKT